ncbi:MAG: AAA family ATPase [Actinobacteria bacterium]|nr:AAA family ATPase [Actinomycetota bacterium]
MLFEIKNIRGIKSIKLSLDGKNAVVFGPNGTGKSAIVDAIDFLLSQKICRLTGKGTRSLSLKEHGCHVDSKGNLKDTVVKAGIEIDGKKVTIQRSINKPSELKVEPKEHAALVESYLDIASLGQHILSRREILKYITAEESERAKEIQLLLDLSEIENLRAMLVKVGNEAEIDFKGKEASLKVAESEIVNLLTMPAFSEQTCLEKVNDLREQLAGKIIAEMHEEKIKEGLMPHLSEARKEMLTKEQIENYINETERILKKKDEIAAKTGQLVLLMEEIKNEAKLKQFSVYKRLFETGIILVNQENICPLCGRKWTDGDFKLHLEERKKKIEIGKEKQDKIDTLSSAIKNDIDVLKNDGDNLKKALLQFNIIFKDEKAVEMKFEAFVEWSEAMLHPFELFETGEWPKNTIEELFDESFFTDNYFVSLKEALTKSGDLLSQQQRAWDTLTKMEDKWKAYKTAVNNKAQADLYKKRADASLTHFGKARNSVLEGIYDAVRGNFDKYYKAIHSEDENKFASKISHEGPALKFEVDFYGRGMFPPHALHSEGHQDSMGLCLFFALNDYLTKNKIQTIVLDDVVMSIDSNHRRDICRLLREFFPEKQFIITTHDTAWAKQLRTENVVSQKNMVHFVNWNVDTGPVFELDKDLWDKIKEALEKDDVPTAAHKLRREAEFFFENACDFLYAKIPYKGNHQWDLGEYASAAISVLKIIVDKAIKNFKKSGQDDKAEELKAFYETAKSVITKSQVEQWAVNAEVHYNEWANLTKNDFSPVVDAFKEVFKLFECSKCHGLLNMERGVGKSNMKTVICNCGNICWNVE